MLIIIFLHQLISVNISLQVTTVIMKNVSRNKFLLCFRPVVEVEFVVESKDTAALDQRKILKRLMTKSSSSHDVCSRNTESSIFVQAPKRRTFSQVVKAVVFETVLAKRAHDRKSFGQIFYGSKHSVSTNSLGPLDSRDDSDIEFQEIKSNPELSTSSSLDSPTSSCSRLMSESKINLNRFSSNKKNQNKQQGGSGKCGSSFNGGILCLLVIILTLTVIFSKFYAIIFTTIWFYFVPSRSRDCDSKSEDDVTKLSKAERFGDYKKRVIMEGLLQRKQLAVHRGGH